MGSVAPRVANQTMISYFGWTTLVDCLMSGSRKKSRMTSALAPMASSPSRSKAFCRSVPVVRLGYMDQLALTVREVMLESMRGRLAELDLMLANECTCVWEAYVLFAPQDQVVEKEVPSWSLSTCSLRDFF